MAIAAVGSTSCASVAVCIFRINRNICVFRGHIARRINTIVAQLTTVNNAVTTGRTPAVCTACIGHGVAVAFAIVALFAFVPNAVAADDFMASINAILRCACPTLQNGAVGGTAGRTVKTFCIVQRTSIAFLTETGIDNTVAAALLSAV